MESVFHFKIRLSPTSSFVSIISEFSHMFGQALAQWRAFSLAVARSSRLHSFSRSGHLSRCCMVCLQLINSQYIPTSFLLSQLKQEHTMLQCLRDHLLQELKTITPSTEHFGDLPARNVVQASAFMRLYCALKGIAGMK